MSKQRQQYVRIKASSNFSRVNTFINVKNILHKVGNLYGCIKPFEKENKE